MNHYLAVLNFSEDKSTTVTIEIDNPIHKGEIVVVDEVRFMVFEIKHIIGNSGHSTYLICDRM